MHTSVLESGIKRYWSEKKRYWKDYEGRFDLPEVMLQSKNIIYYY